MGKASRWFRSLLGLQNSDPNCDRIHKPPTKKRWRFPKSDRDKDRHRSRPAVAPGAGDDGDDSSKHAIAVAAATAAVAEAAVAAAHAAAVVVRLTSSCRIISTAGIDGAACVQSPVSGRGARYGSREEWAAVIAQSHFRAYLSRRALRALKALVRLQALVRGHLVRKQTAYALRQLQALVRAQARALAGRALYYDSPQSSTKSLHFNYPGPPTPDKSECVAIRATSMNHEPSTMLKRNTSKSKSRTSENPSLQTDHDKSDKVLEVDSWNTPASSRKQAHFLSGLSPSSCEAHSSSPLRLWQQNPDESAFCTAENSPTFHSATSSKKGAFSSYSDFPSYMACTESSRAKARSVSAPKQRPEYERSSSTKRYSIHGFGDLRSAQRVLGFTSKAYPGSGRLDRLGIPVTSDVRLSGGGNWYRS